MMRRFFQLLGTFCLSLSICLTAQSQTTFVPPPQQAQTGVVPYGGRPLLQVAPDGAVHLDGAMTGQVAPGYAGQQAVIGQPQPGYYYQQPGMYPPQRSGLLGGYFSNNTIVPMYEHRFSVWGDFLYIRPRNAEVAYALPIVGPIGVAPPLGQEVPFGPVAVVDFEFEPAFRAGFKLRLHEDSSLAAQYSYLRTTASDSATVIAPLVLRSLVSHPGAANTATDTLDANATHGIDYDLIDADFRALVDGCEICDAECAHAINVILGGRYVRLDQQFQSNFAVLGINSVNTNVDFEGGGIRMGVEGERHATRRGFFAYGKGIGNLMVGRFKADYLQVNSISGNEAITSYETGRVVPSVDLEVGVGWVAPRRRLRLSAGYMASWWFNVVKTEDFINAVQNHMFHDPTGVLTFDGLTTRAEWQF